MFILITLIYILILFIAYFGDYKSKEIENDKKKWEEITGRKYDWNIRMYVVCIYIIYGYRNTSDFSL